MIEGQLYVNKSTGGLYECKEVHRELAVMHRITTGYEGKDPRRVAVFLDQEPHLDWEYADNDELDDQIAQNDRAIENARAQIQYWDRAIEEFEQTSSYLRDKKEMKRNGA